MKFLAKRIIQYLLLDSDLINLLDGEKNIFPEFAPIQKDKYITVSTSVGRDEDPYPIDRGTLIVSVVVSRKVNNAWKVCFDLVEKVDSLLNKNEINVSSDSYKVLYLVRRDSSGLQIDESQEYYWFSLEYEYMLINE